jgi:hypothetical protein
VFGLKSFLDLAFAPLGLRLHPSSLQNGLVDPLDFYSFPLVAGFETISMSGGRINVRSHRLLPLTSEDASGAHPPSDKVLYVVTN